MVKIIPSQPILDQKGHRLPNRRRHGPYRAETKLIVQKTLDAIINVLATEGRVELRNFGVFKVKRRKPRQARNPRTGEMVMV